jgi:hypothetical protein
MSTVATLLVVPSIFALVVGRRVAHSPSIYPEDPDSPHYDPESFPSDDDSGEEVATPQAGQAAPSHPIADGSRHNPDGGDAPASGSTASP